MRRKRKCFKHCRKLREKEKIFMEKEIQTDREKREGFL